VAGKVDRGVAICGSGVGASVCANKVNGVRACLIHDHFSAKQGIEDDHTNILCMGGPTVGPEVAWISSKLISPPNTAAPRDIFHVRQHRAGKVAALESERRTP
jgi:ribose 5-phosphate isomerase B